MNITLRFASVFALAAAALAASAAPITYTLTGTGTGSLNGTSFTNSTYTISLVTDTSLVTTNGTLYVSEAPATVSIAGVSDTLTSGRAYSYAPSGQVGFSNGGTAFSPVIVSVSGASAIGYDLKSSIGPISGTPAYNTVLSFATSRGTFSLTASSSATFSAQTAVNPTPEPSVLAALGLGAVAMLRRRKRA